MADLTAFQALAPGDEPVGLVDLLYGAGRPSWYRDAACVERPEVTFFPELGQSAAPAKAVCERCLVRAECLAYALGHTELEGVWGATSSRERGRLRRRSAAA